MEPGPPAHGPDFALDTGTAAPAAWDFLMNTESPDPQKQIQYLATALATIGGYYAMRASLQLPGFREAFVGMDTDSTRFSVGGIILNHPYAMLALVMAVMAATLFAIWRPFRYHNIIYPAGIAFLFFLADRAVAACMDPVLRMIETMSQ